MSSQCLRNRFVRSYNESSTWVLACPKLSSALAELWLYITVLYFTGIYAYAYYDYEYMHSVMRFV